MGKTALVTGASRGIGRAIAAALAAEKYRILALGRDADALMLTCQGIARIGGEARPVLCDLRDDRSVERAVEQAVDHEGLDLVVHNAGVGGGGRVDEGQLDRWDTVMEVDLRAPMRLTALTLAAVVKRQGAMVFIGSVASKMGMAGAGAYCAAKHGLAGFAEALFEEVREQGVRVTSIHPGFVNTGMVAGRELDYDKMIQPDDIAELVLAAVKLPVTACVTEMVVRPQRTPYL